MTPDAAPRRAARPSTARPADEPTIRPCSCSSSSSPACSLTPFLIRRFGRPAGAGRVRRDANPLTQYGFRLTESAKAAGLDFVHQAPTLDPKLAHIMPQVASMGAAVSVVDFDRDGWPDLYVTDSKEGSKNRLYRNQGDGTFEDVAERLGVADVNHAEHRRVDGRGLGRLRQRRLRGPVPLPWGRPELFHNDGGQGFTRVTRAGGPAGVGQRQHAPSGSTTTATAGSICSSAATTRRRSTSGSSPTRR